MVWRAKIKMQKMVARWREEDEQAIRDSEQKEKEAEQSFSGFVPSGGVKWLTT